MNLKWTPLGDTAHILLYLRCMNRSVCVSPLTGERAQGLLHNGACAVFRDSAAVYPYYITVMNLSHEYSYKPSAMRLSGESLNVGVVSRTPDTHYG